MKAYVVCVSTTYVWSLAEGQYYEELTVRDMWRWVNGGLPERYRSKVIDMNLECLLS